MRRALLVALLLALTGCGAHTSRAAPKPTPISTPSPSAAGCHGLVLLGFRGQGQSTHGHHGLGQEADQVTRALVARLAPTPVELVRVSFPARSAEASAYDADVATGVRSAGRVIRSTCRRVVLVGYSQGAEVVHRVAVAHPRQVALAVLLGDPLRNPTDQVTTLSLGTGSLSGRGNAGAGSRFPGVVRTHVVEVCVQGDDVCNAPPTGRLGPPSAAHRTGYQDEGNARTVAARAARLTAESS